MRTRVLVLLAFTACKPKEECFPYDVAGVTTGDLHCEQVDICCTKETFPECAYVTKRDERYECLSQVDCNGAAKDLICDVCDIPAEVADQMGCE